MYPPHHVRSVSPPEAQGSTCLEKVPSYPQCDSSHAFQLKVILKHELHSLRKRCLSPRVVQRMRYKVQLQAYPHCPLARYSPGGARLAIP